MSGDFSLILSVILTDTEIIKTLKLIIWSTDKFNGFDMLHK